VLADIPSLAIARPIQAKYPGILSSAVTKQGGLCSFLGTTATLSAMSDQKESRGVTLEPALMEAILEELADQELLEKVRARLASNSAPVDVNIDDL
jgi:hypothetical protein